MDTLTTTTSVETVNTVEAVKAESTVKTEKASSFVEKVSDSIAKLLVVLTWSKVGMLACVGVIVAAGVLFDDLRPTINKRLSLSVMRFGQSSIPYPSYKTQQNIQALVDRSKPIVAVQLVNFDFQRNEKHPIYFYSDNSDLTHAMAVYQSERLTLTPLFITGDEANNARMVDVINGSFVCVDIPARIVQAVPLAGKEAKALCSISIPPYYGKTVGYANVWLDHMPTNDEVPQFRSVARTLSVDVYERDVNPGPT